MSEIQYNFEQITGLVGQMSSNMKKLEAQMENLKSHINVMNSNWDSTAREAQNAAQDKWNKAHNEAVLLLQQLTKRTDEGNQAMSQTNDSIAKSWM